MGGIIHWVQVAQYQFELRARSGITSWKLKLVLGEPCRRSDLNHTAIYKQLDAGNVATVV